jgi:hypothetical protein
MRLSPICLVTLMITVGLPPGLSARQGHAASQVSLGFNYERGRGVAPDPVQAAPGSSSPRSKVIP